MSVSTELFLEYKKRPGRAVLARLIERHQDAVYSLCCRVLRHPQDAEDACQEVLLEVARQVDAIEDPAGFAGWLYRTALHTALDAKRRRGRRKAREAAATPASRPAADADASREALQQGLAGLDETSRMLVVEHYLAQRPLRELADERGCSEVAVWKRIRNARERLRQTLGSAAMAALEGAAKVRAPASVIQAVAIQGGVMMAAKGGIKIAVVAPLLLLAGAGTMVYVRQPEAPTERPVQVSRRTSIPSPTVVLPGAEPAPAPSAIDPVAVAGTSIPRPYPLRLPAPGYADAARRVWGILSTRRMTLDYQNELASNLLREIGLMLGVTFVVDPRFQEHQISFKVGD